MFINFFAKHTKTVNLLWYSQSFSMTTSRLCISYISLTILLYQCLFKRFVNVLEKSYITNHHMVYILVEYLITAQSGLRLYKNKIILSVHIKYIGWRGIPNSLIVFVFFCVTSFKIRKNWNEWIKCIFDIMDNSKFIWFWYQTRCDLAVLLVIVYIYQCW